MLSFVFIALGAILAAADLEVGVGIADVTGATAQVGMMGYAKEGQNTAGLHFRQRSRAYAMRNNATGNSVVFVSVDIAMVFSNIKADVMQRLAAHPAGVNYKEADVALTAIHDHGGPGGFSKFTLYEITTLGYDNQTAEAIVSGITQSIVAAFLALRPAAPPRLLESKIYNVSRNRSPTSYLADPASERSLYDGDVDSTFQLIRFDDAKGNALGSAAWHAVHCTSMSNTNLLITGDNKGFASLVFEAAINQPSVSHGQGPFVAAFFASNLGDVSPNTMGAFCPDGTPCDPLTSTCGGYNEGCQAYGPGGTDFFESTRVVGTRQADHAALQWRAAPSAGRALDGAIASRLVWVDMVNGTVPKEFSQTGVAGVTCAAALGEAFAAGTTDGPGAFNFVQGNTSLNPFWELVRGVIRQPTAWQVECQAPKPVLLDVGELPQSGDGPARLLGTHWVAASLPFQVMRISADPPVIVCFVPGEMTTMSGRRLRKTVAAAYANAHNERVARGDSSAVPVRTLDAAEVTITVSGLSNEYSHYIATWEEYQRQRYEAASTLYGPHTLGRHLFAFASLAASIARGDYNYPPGLASPAPPIPDQTFSFIPGVGVDIAPTGTFGAVHLEPNAEYRRGSTVHVEFWGGNPRNNLKPHPKYGYLVVEVLSNGAWVPVADDSAWETQFAWNYVIEFVSKLTVQWAVPATAVAGKYRITHFGFHKELTGSVLPYSGTTRTFEVTP